MTEVNPTGVAVHAQGTAAEANAATILSFFREVLCGPDGLAEIARFVSPGFADEDGASGQAGVAGKLRGLWTAFPDGAFFPLEIVAAGDRVAARSLFRATRPPARTVPDGSEAVTVAFADFYRLEGGLIVAHAHVVDTAAFAGNAAPG